MNVSRGSMSEDLPQPPHIRSPCAYLQIRSAGFFAMSEKLRLLLIEEAAKRDVNIIFTFCYDFPYDDGFVKNVIQKVEKHGGKVHFVHLYCNKSELLKKVKCASRESFDKLRSKRKLSRTLKYCDFFSPISLVENLRIDNTKLSVAKTAMKIRDHYRLGK